MFTESIIEPGHAQDYELPPRRFTDPRAVCSELNRSTPLEMNVVQANDQISNRCFSSVDEYWKWCIGESN